MKKFTVPNDCQIPQLAEIYNTYFQNIETGFFIEVGAYDGKSWTNTGFLADIGWKGIYIEPIKTYMDRCKENHKNNKVFFEQCAIGSANKNEEIYVLEGLSTIDENVNNAHQQLFNCESKLKQTIQVNRLDFILGKYQVNKKFDLLVVDTEGYEKEVFESFSLSEYIPRMIIVELCDVHPSYNIFPKIQEDAKYVRDKIKSFNYNEIFVDSINTIFWKNNE